MVQRDGSETSLLDEDDHTLLVQPVGSNPTRTARRIWPAVLIILGLLAICLASLALLSPLPTRLHLPATRVGPRSFSPQYYQQWGGCDSTQLLEALGQSQISPQGRSRKIDRANYTHLTLPPDFQYSFDLPGCPAPHVYTTAEACDLVESFGGIFLRGDSLVRHLQTALLMLLVSEEHSALHTFG